MGEYWEEEDEQVKEEYGEKTRQRKGLKYEGDSLWMGKFKEETKEVEAKKEKAAAPSWGSAFRNS